MRSQFQTVRVCQVCHAGVMSSKTCSQCHESKPVSEFRSRSGKHAHLLTSWCKSCTRIKDREYRLRNPEKIRQIRRNYRRPDRWPVKVQVDYDALYAAQDGRCAICRSTDPGRGRVSFCLDHDHNTHQPRGLLCSPCNYALGQFKDDLDLLKMAVTYLEAHR